MCRKVDLQQDADRAIEREANIFASELLMPEAAVRAAWGEIVGRATEIRRRRWRRDWTCRRARWGGGCSILGSRREARVSGQESLGFLPGMAEKLHYYVYALTDPFQGGRIFYVGKGFGDRVYQHAALARVVDGKEGRKGLKIATIQAIHRQGLQVGVEIIRHGLTDAEAYTVEAGVIDALRLAGVELTNLARGKGSGARGWMSLDEIRAEYAASPVKIDLSHRVVLIRITSSPAAMSDDELYERTREWWRMNPRRRADYAFSVHDGIVRAVFAIDSDPSSWERADNGRRRFSGVRSPDLEASYVWRDVSSYLPFGAQNPIRYVNC